MPAARAILTASLLLVTVLALQAWRTGHEPAPALAQSGPTTVTFQYTGREQTWTVPDGVTQATFTVSGAQGGSQSFAGVSGGTLCGSAVTDSGGRLQLVVAAHPSPPGCGRLGAHITIHLNGRVSGESLRFQPGRTATVALRLPDVPLPLPIGWP